MVLFSPDRIDITGPHALEDAFDTQSPHINMAEQDADEQQLSPGPLCLREGAENGKRR